MMKSPAASIKKGDRKEPKLAERSLLGKKENLFWYTREKREKRPIRASRGAIRRPKRRGKARELLGGLQYSAAG